MATWREIYLSQLTCVHTGEQGIFSALAKITKEIGYDFCSFGVSIPVLGRDPSQSWSSTYSAKWQEHYYAHNYMVIDPVISAALPGSMPVVLGDGLFREQRNFWEDAKAHGVCHGWSLGMHGSRGRTGLISLARSAEALTAKELADTEPKLLWLSHIANVTIGNLVAQTLPPVTQPLSAREREVLCWTSVGKTSHEIGMILNISTRTVNFHIAGLLLKLNAVNKIQAVAKAIMLGLL